MVAKACVQEIESRQEEIEKKYIAKNGIVNSDGDVPKRIYCIDNDTVFEKANEECSTLIRAAGLEDELNAARAELKTAEDHLIMYGLSLAPTEIRATLEKGVKDHLAVRQKVLDLAFRLDTSTIRAQ